jgi:hypothetical protein
VFFVGVSLHSVVNKHNMLEFNLALVLRAWNCQVIFLGSTSVTSIQKHIQEWYLRKKTCRNVSEVSGVSPYPYSMRACTSSAHDNHDATDVKACIQKLPTDLPDVLKASFSKCYL